MCESLSTECLSLNDQSFMTRPTLIDFNLVELKYYPFMISSDKCHGSFNNISRKCVFPKNAKDINFKVFNMITNENEAKTNSKAYFM